MHEIEIYTDGACRNNQATNKEETLGAWAYLIKKANSTEALRIDRYDSKAIPNTTNNQMELQAVIEALDRIPRTLRLAHSVKIFSDSMYIVKGINEWLHGWLRASFKGIKNADQWKTLSELIVQYGALQAIHVQGHSTSTTNLKVDIMCNDVMNAYIKEKNQLKNIKIKKNKGDKQCQKSQKTKKQKSKPPPKQKQ